jgi:hypothetical protein
MSHLKQKFQAVKKFLTLVTELTNKPEIVSNKVAFIIANPYYESFRLKLGDPCCNDAILIAEYYNTQGYKCYGLVDPSKQQFVDYLNHFTQSNMINDLIVYYAGHGNSIPDKSFKYINGKCVPTEKDENDGRDETWVFKDGDLVDDEMKEIWDNNKCGNILVLSDSCHSGTIVETTRNNITSFCGCCDSQCSIQLARNGIFTYFLMDYAKKNTNLKQLQTLLNKKIGDYGQNCVLIGQRDKLIL